MGALARRRTARRSAAWAVVAVDVAVGVDEADVLKVQIHERSSQRDASAAWGSVRVMRSTATPAPSSPSTASAAAGMIVVAGAT